jgi:hypothetical protein
VISTTGEHPFWTPDKGWVEAKDLVVGSLVQTEDGRIIDVDRVDKREGDFTVYNFKVEGFHTYFVSDLGVLVHNAGCGEFPNLYPEDFPTPIPRYEIFFDGDKWRYKSPNGNIRTPNGQYNFVVQEGQVYITREKFGLGGHVDLAGGSNVDFAGQIRFGSNPSNRGQIKFWNNASGHYQPNAASATNGADAGLPLDLFSPHTEF